MTSNKSLRPSDRVEVLAIKQTLKMARSAHVHVRGSTVQFYQWLENQKKGTLPEGPPVWICGDCHAGNLGPVARRRWTRRHSGSRPRSDRDRQTGGPEEPLPPEYWQSVLQDPRALSKPPAARQRRLSEIERHLLRVSCLRCERIVEIQKVDAVRLYRREAVWKDVGQRLLGNTCQLRTGRHEEDGSWPSFE
jgi:hypothetical protein